MNTSQGALHFGASIDLNQWHRDIESMRRDISGLTSNVQNQTRNIDSAFKNLSVGIAGYFSASALKSFVMEMVNVRGEFQKTEIAFTTMLGNAGKANALMGQMVELAAKTPFSLQDVSSGAKQLLAFQVPANEVVDTLTRMGNIAAGLGVPLSRINLVYGQVRAKGKLMGDDLRQFTEAGIPMIAELAKKFNTTTGAIIEMVSAGKIGFKDVQDVLFSMTNEGGMFFNLMEMQSKSLSGQVANLGDAWDQMLNKIGEGQQGILSDGIKGLTFLVEHYEDVGKAILTLVEIYGAYRAALLVTSALQTRVAAPAILQGLSSLIQLIRGATVAQTALNTASLANPYILLATGIAALIAVVYNYRTELGQLTGIIKEQTASQKAQEAVMESYNSSFGKGVSETKANISQLISIIRNENSTLDQRKAAYERLISIDSAFRGVLDGQYKATYKLGDAFTYVIGKIDAFAMAQAKAAASKKFLESSFEEQFKAGALKTHVLDADAEFKKYEKLDAEARKAGKASLDYMRKASDAESKRNKLAEEWRKQQDLANEKTSISNAIVRNNNAEITQKEKQLSLIEKEIKLGKLSGEALEKRKRQAEKIKYELSGFKPVEEAVVSGIPTNTPEVEKKKEAHKRDLAEVYSKGSIADLEQRISLWNEALSKASGENVQALTKNKYGDTVKSGKTVSIAEALAEVTKLEEAKAKREREISIQSFDDQLAETERQWKVKYQLAKYYGQEVADAQFPELTTSYYADISKRFEDLNTKRNSGVSLSESELSQWQKLKDILSTLTGEKDSLSNFNDQMEESLQKLPTLFDQVEHLQKLRDSLQNSDVDKGYYATVNNLLQEKLKEEKTAYQQLLNEHKTFAEKKIQIETETAKSIDKINADSSLTQEQKQSYSGAVSNKSKEEVSQIAVDELTKSRAWMSLYGNIDDLTVYQMQVLLDELEAKKDNLAKVLTPVDFKVLLKNFRDVKNKIADENPFLGLFDSLQDLFNAFGQQSEEAGQQGFDAFEKASDGIRGTLKAAKGIISTLEPAREYMSETANDAIDTIDQVATMGMGMMQAIEGTVKAVKTALDKASWSNWITAIISIIYTVIKAIVSLFTWMAKNKTKKINREIKEWQAQVDELKNSYEELQRVIEKTAGEAQLTMQRELISNLREQQKILNEMRAAESKKKKADQDKIASYTQQIQDINVQIQQIVDDFKTSVTTVGFKDLAENLASALVDAFGKGEDAAQAFDKVVDDVMRNAVINALKIKYVQPVADEFVNKLYQAMGYGGSSGATAEQAALLQNYKNLLADAEKNLASSSPVFSSVFQNQIKNYKELIKQLEAEISANAMSGAFDGLTQDEIDLLKNDYKNDPRLKGFLEGIKKIDEFFDTTFESAQSLKGDIKGITEKTAGALEAQFNAMRINLVAVLQIAKKNNIVLNAANVLLSQIEVNTRNLHQIRKDISEMNSKMKGKLAGIP